MSILWKGFRGRPAQVIARMLVGAFLLTTAVVRPAMAQNTPTPEAQGYRGAGQESLYTGDFADLAITIDSFWSTTFQAVGIPYVSPGIVPLDQVRDTACGRHGPGSGALYCTLDSTIYLSPFFLAEKDTAVGDYAPITILAHEWGHHVQLLTRALDPGGSTFELQADCLAGVYTQTAEMQGLLDPGDISEAVTLSRDSGDPLGLPDEPGLQLHGTNDDRIKAFMRGYLNGLADCNLPGFSGGNLPVDETLSIPELDQVEQFSLHVLDTLPLPHTACFGIVDDGTLNFEQLLGRFSGVPDAATRLQTWGWQASAFRQFGCAGPPEGEAGWIDISLHLFGTPLAAQEAVDYFAAVRAAGSSLVSAAPPAIGDHAAVLSGPASNGTEFTIYASQGPLLVRVTGVSPSGIPFMNVLTVAQSVLAAQQGLPQLTPTRSMPEVSLPASAYLPGVPFVRHRECFEVLTEGTFVYTDVAAALLPTGLTQSQFDELGWQDGAYIVFVCDEPPDGRASQIDVGIHQFQDSTSAQQALPYYSVMYASGEHQARGCDAAENVVICVSGRSISGSPLSDVHFVLNQVVGAVR